MGCVYIATNMLNSKSYVGKTKRSFESRWYEHFTHSSLERGYPFHLALKKYKESGFLITIVKESNSIKELNELEKVWILVLRSNESSYGYNITNGGDGGNSCIHTFWINDGSRSRMIRREFQIPAGWSIGRLPCGSGVKKGFKHSSSTKQKMSKTRKGRDLSKITRRKQLESAIGTIWITNGVKNKHFRKEEPLPAGWIYGLTKKHQATNEKIQEVHDEE